MKHTFTVIIVAFLNYVVGCTTAPRIFAAEDKDAVSLFYSSTNKYAAACALAPVAKENVKAQLRERIAGDDLRKDNDARMNIPEAGLMR